MPTAYTYRSIPTGVERLPAGICLPRHRHREGYANVVLTGSFTEASFAGRFQVQPGHVLLHGAFDCHANDSVGARGPQILRLPWLRDDVEGAFRVADADALAALAERDPIAATAELERMLIPIPPAGLHWTEALAAALRADPGLRISEWSERRGMAPETVSRGFARAFGTTPRQFRLEVRTRLAWRRIVSSPASLTTIAHQTGFADQAHMTRSVRQFTGQAPSTWRARGQLRSSDSLATLLASIDTP
jgi:AraC-like DNA-binding protein